MTANSIVVSSDATEGPLTAAAYAELCAERTWHSKRIPVHVQFRKLGVVHCGRVVEVKPGSDGKDWFRLDAGSGPQWATHFNVRACEGNGYCQCEAEADAAAAACRATAPAGAVPLGNTGTTNGAVL